MKYKNILIGMNTLFPDWFYALKRIKEEHIFLIDFEKSDILKIIEEKDINYILPLSEKDYNIVKNIISENIIILYPSEETYKLFNNKILFTKFMFKNFIDYIPKVFYLENKKINEIEYPVIYKPFYSVGGYNMKIYHNENDFFKCNDKTIIQKFIEHEYEYSAYIISIKGIIIKSKIIRYKYEKYNIKKVNFPSDYENIVNFDIIKIFEKILIKSNYTGSAFTNNFINELLCIN
jgi:carbamoylphosphate synthase large subunit